jgi:hypothetical protein
VRWAGGVDTFGYSGAYHECKSASSADEVHGGRTGPGRAGAERRAREPHGGATTSFSVKLRGRGIPAA